MINNLLLGNNNTLTNTNNNNILSFRNNNLLSHKYTHIQTQHYTTMFKHRNESRFFNDKYSHDFFNNGDSINNSIYSSTNDIPQSILNLIDQLFLRIPFFKKFENCFDFKTCELLFCKKKYKNINDNWFDFIVKNTRI
jgi:hypothetical protein